MKRKLLSTLPEVFCLRPTGGYSRFVIASKPDTAARRNWVQVGRRLQSAITQVGDDVEKKKQAA